MRALFLAGVFLGEVTLCLAQSKSSSPGRIARWYDLGWYEKIIQAAEQNPVTFQEKKLLYVASAYYSTGQKEVALRAYQQAFVGAPDASATFHTEYARLLHEKGELLKARQQYRIALEKGANPEEIQLYLRYIQNAAQAVLDTTYRIERLPLSCNEDPTYAAYLAAGVLYYMHRCERPGCKIYPTGGYPYE
jgi:tetratricopeptide (TPR) repeat protein